MPENRIYPVDILAYTGVLCKHAPKIYIITVHRGQITILPNPHGQDTVNPSMVHKEMVMIRKILLTCVLAMSLACVATAADSAQKKLVIACVGDSITEMQGKKQGISYPGYLQKLLGDGYEVINYGKSGSCVLKNSDYPYRKCEAFNNFSKSQPDIVVIALGTNDSRPNNWARKADFAASYQFLIDTARNLPSKPTVLVALPIPMITFPGKFQYSLNGDTIANEIVPQIRKIAEENKCPVIDLFANYTSKPETYIDGVHPSDEGLEQMAKLVSVAISALPQRAK